MDIPALFNKKDDQKSDEAASQPMGVLGDPLATAPADDASAATAASTAADDQTSDDQSTPIVLDGQILVPNQTIDTNDRSKVGDLKDLEKPKPEPINADVANFLGVPTPPQPEPEESVDEPSEVKPDLTTDLPLPTPEPEDPEKTAFIKTYTQEFDDALRRATDAAQKILDAIDTAVHEHSSDIAIPEEAGEFMDQKLEDGKVQKFEDARAIVREVMTRAAEAKEQSAQAAAEAAKVYDEVQQFKKETKEQIAELVAEDE